MTNTRALLLFLAGAVLIALGAIDHLLIEGLVAAGVEVDPVAPLPWLAPALATSGFVLLLLGLGAYLQVSAKERRIGPYREALTPVAAEFGRGIVESDGYIELEVHRDGQRVELRLDPRPGGGLRVRSTPPSRQALGWLRPGAVPRGPGKEWREVERTPHWQLHAELPAMARPLLSDPVLMQVVDPFFEDAQGLAVAHTVAGMAIDATLVPPEAVAAQARLGVEIAFRLRRVNG